MSGRVLIMAGGTGGHVFPALAVADALRARGIEVVWMGTRLGLEARVVPEAGIRVEWIAIAGLRGKNLLTRLAAPFRILLAVAQALRIMLRVKPAVVLGMGGYAAGPGGVAAWLTRRPLVIHEQNAIAGTTNQILARLSSRVLAAFPGAFPGGVSSMVVGNPVRASIAALPGPDRRLADRTGPVHLLVLGGSQGALALNQTVPEALAHLPEEQRPLVRHQAGRNTLEVARAAYARFGVAAEVSEFIDDMAAAYGWADLAICRSGALTVSELAAAGVPAVLVPFPAAVDDHQTLNGGYLVAAGAAVLVPESQLDPDRLSHVLAGLLGDRGRRLDMARRARGAARTEALSTIERVLLDVGGLAAEEAR
ncbi:undecaprenyldiphospho-muramoylpentapeptide beta-N-acetylglucosaminyltransferase [Wenzhouxiangella sp. XN24]|uniref:undecaprenyldiphospho-muramoylpentapeptide beta-N-acetylglucosaminyltransferase n=1 Tax=Wenzhouxiangella sp. XN24 TaxID=2713569 RepID=UPI0013EB8046|nr:undecaprenyldiphospho-muramoylpentapeptide beta-N-acetylglucosaminyltransferase [Wenzhouxiangella sp. XN24]NGX15223.1 undecaprenyldiphospho-muramoylpentapeptide beta-N-acetylglucosaminyltransferase [Wenzhouxiangella sp. XN24]